MTALLIVRRADFDAAVRLAMQVNDWPESRAVAAASRLYRVERRAVERTEEKAS